MKSIQLPYDYKTRIKNFHKKLIAKNDYEKLNIYHIADLLNLSIDESIVVFDYLNCDTSYPYKIYLEQKEKG